MGKTKSKPDEEEHIEEEEERIEEVKGEQLYVEEEQTEEEEEYEATDETSFDKKCDKQLRPFAQYIHENETPIEL